MSLELELMQSIEKFGVDAVLGRRLYVGEMKRLRAAQNVYNIYKSRAASDNWAKWAEDNRRAAEILTFVESLKDG